MIKNTQPIEKATHHPDGVLFVHSVFHTIQGEGPFCGTPAVFIRLWGCNLQCPGCDTDYTSKREVWQPEKLIYSIQKFAKNGLVVITGGEPFRQNISPLVNQLVTAGYYVQIETNGTLPAPLQVVWNRNISVRMGAYIVVSPKTGKVHPSTERYACAFKYVAKKGDIDDDGLPLHALDHTASPRVARPAEERVVYLQPMDEQDDRANWNNLQACIESCMQHGHILQLQTHKIIDME